MEQETEIKLPAELKVKYFDIIYEFGLLTNTGLSPVESKDHPYRIQVRFRGPDGIESKCTAYGKDVIQVCQRALEFLEPLGWKGHSQLTLEGLVNFAHGIKNMMEQAGRSGKVEVIE